MSPRTRRQELRRARLNAAKPYGTASPQSMKVKRSAASNESELDMSCPSLTSQCTTQESTSTADSPANLGLPSRAQYLVIEDEYIRSLHPRKREKALLSQGLFDKIWDVLHEPNSQKIGTPQFRWWVRKMFVLSHPHSGLSPAEMESLGIERALPVVLHENRPAALKDQIYDVLCYCHQLANHGGRDKTTAVIREHYSWIPKELISQFVKACPTCVFKKTGRMSLALSMNNLAPEPYDPRVRPMPELALRDADVKPFSMVRSSSSATAYSVSLPAKDLVNNSDEGHYFLNPEKAAMYANGSWSPTPGLDMAGSEDGLRTGWQPSHYSREPSQWGTDVPWMLRGNTAVDIAAPRPQRFVSADGVLQHEGLHPIGRAPPHLMRPLSEGVGLRSPAMQSMLIGPDDVHLSPYANHLVINQWRETTDGAPCLGDADDDPFGPSAGRGVPIDPALLQEETNSRLETASPTTQLAAAMFTASESCDQLTMPPLMTRGDTSGSDSSSVLATRSLSVPEDSLPFVSPDVEYPPSRDLSPTYRPSCIPRRLESLAPASRSHSQDSLEQMYATASQDFSGSSSNYSLTEKT